MNLIVCIFLFQPKLKLFIYSSHNLISINISDNFNKVSSIHDLTNANNPVTFNSDVYDVNVKTNDDINEEIVNNSIELVPLLNNNDLKSNKNKDSEIRCNTIDYFPKIYSPPEATTSKLSICKVSETIIEPICESKQNSEYRKKSTKISTVKKVSSKINGRYKIKRRKSREHQKLQSTLSKPVQYFYLYKIF